MNYIVERSSGDLENIEKIIHAIYMIEDGIPVVESELIGFFSDMGLTSQTKLDGDDIITNPESIDGGVLKILSETIGRGTRKNYPASGDANGRVYFGITKSWIEDKKNMCDGYKKVSITKEQVKGVTTLESAVNMLLEKF